MGENYGRAMGNRALNDLISATDARTVLTNPIGKTYDWFPTTTTTTSSIVTPQSATMDSIALLGDVVRAIEELERVVGSDGLGSLTYKDEFLRELAERVRVSESGKISDRIEKIIPQNKL